MLSSEIISNHLNIEEFTVPSVLMSISNTCMGILCSIIDDVLAMDEEELFYLQILFEDYSLSKILNTSFCDMTKLVLDYQQGYEGVKATTAFSENHTLGNCSRNMISALLSFNRILDEHLVHQDYCGSYLNLKDDDRAINALSLFAKNSGYDDLQSLFKKYGPVIESILIEGNMFKNQTFMLVSEDGDVNDDAQYIFDKFASNFDVFIKFLINELTNAEYEF